MTLIDQLHKNGTTVCMVTHDPHSASRAQRTIEVFDGQIVSDQMVNEPAAIIA